MMGKLWKVFYGLAGAALALAVALTAEYGLSEKNREIYRRAVDMEDRTPEADFPDFRFSDHAVRFFDGSNDYVVRGDIVEKEEAALPVFAGTIWMTEDGEYQVLVPAYEKMASFYELMATAAAMSQPGDRSVFPEESYTEESHVATLWHESFHIWQTRRFGELIDRLSQRAYAKEGDDRESVIVKEVDSKESYVISYTKMMKLLMKSIREETDPASLQYLREALALEKEMNEALNDAALSNGILLENMEGSAMYVEAGIYRALTSEEEYEKYYLGDFEYTGGSSKYYTLGFYKCLLLDRFSEGWKENFSLEHTLTELLTEAVSEGE